MLSLNAKDYFDSRTQLRFDFLSRVINAPYDCVALTADWASRRYFRVYSGEKTVVLMEAIPDHTGAFTPGHRLSDFIRIGRFLHGIGIKTPEIIAMDEREGFLLLEDFGDITMADAFEKGGDKPSLYHAATDILIHLRDHIKKDDLALPLYQDSHVHKGRRRIVDWYLPAIRRTKNQDGLVESYLAAWDEIERNLPPCPMGFVHGDYHPQNMMVTAKGLGILDFQGAMWGPVPYDLANLLEDIRRDVPPFVRDEMIQHYMGKDFVLTQWYRVMATQFHCRILGQTLRLAIAGGRPDFLKFIPRVQNYIQHALMDPLLKPLADWMKRENVDLHAQGCFDPSAVKPFIREDAF